MTNVADTHKPAPITHERLAEMIGQNTPCVPATGVEAIMMAREVMAIRNPLPTSVTDERVEAIGDMDRATLEIWLPGVTVTDYERLKRVAKLLTRQVVDCMPLERNWWAFLPMAYAVIAEIDAASLPPGRDDAVGVDDEDDALTEVVAKAIALHGVGRSWDDFEETNAFDLDHGDLREYARAAIDALEPAQQPIDRAEPFLQPSRRDGKEPCGECHLKPGETCDICGAIRALSKPEPVKG